MTELTTGFGAPSRSIAIHRHRPRVRRLWGPGWTARCERCGWQEYHPIWAMAMLAALGHAERAPRFVVPL